MALYRIVLDLSENVDSEDEADRLAENILRTFSTVVADYSIQEED